MATYLADQVIVFEGIAATAHRTVLFLSLYCVWENLIAIVSSPQTTIASHRISSNNVPSRPDELPATCETYSNSVKDKEQKGFVLLMSAIALLVAFFCSVSGNYVFPEE